MFFIARGGSIETMSGFNNYFAPALKSPDDLYPLWDANKCANCLFSYQTAGTPAQVDLCTSIDNDTDISDLINWYQAYRGAPNQNSDLNCDTKINVDDLIFWYQKYRS